MWHNTFWISRSCAPFERIEAARQINKSKYCFGKCEHQTFFCWSTINKYTILHNTHLHVFNFRISLCLSVYFSLLMFCTKKISKEFFQMNQGSRNRFFCAYGIVLKMANIRIKRNNCNPNKAKFAHSVKAILYHASLFLYNSNIFTVFKQFTNKILQRIISCKILFETVISKILRQYVALTIIQWFQKMIDKKRKI